MTWIERVSAIAPPVARGFVLAVIMSGCGGSKARQGAHVAPIDASGGSVSLRQDGATGSDTGGANTVDGRRSLDEGEDVLAIDAPVAPGVDGATSDSPTSAPASLRPTPYVGAVAGGIWSSSTQFTLVLTAGGRPGPATVMESTKYWLAGGLAGRDQEK